MALLQSLTFESSYIEFFLALVSDGRKTSSGQKRTQDPSRCRETQDQNKNYIFLSIFLSRISVLFPADKHPDAALDDVELGFLLLALARELRAPLRRAPRKRGLG